MNSQPPGAHTQCATTEYTAITQIGTNTIQAENFARSAMAPLISAAVRMAKVSWKVTKSSSGTEPCTVPGSMPVIATCERSPISPPLPSPEKASVYPSSSHATVTSGIAMKLIMIMLSTPVVRTMPP